MKKQSVHFNDCKLKELLKDDILAILYLHTAARHFLLVKISVTELDKPAALSLFINVLLAASNTRCQRSGRASRV